MGSNRLANNTIIDNDSFTTISNRSIFNDGKRSNRGRAVENSKQTCGKLGENSKENCGKIDARTAENKANALICIFNAPHCRRFFLKCIYHLNEQDIADAVDVATRPDIISPIRYFNKVCKQKLSEQGL